MEMGLIVDDRDYGPDDEYILELTPIGWKLYEIFKPLIQKIDLSFSDNRNGLPSWRMNLNPQEFNKSIWDFIKNDKNKREIVQEVFLNVHAVYQMLNYLYRIERKKVIPKSDIYQGFFNAPFIKMYCDQNGIDIATEEGARHRCPFLLNVLESIGILEQTRNEITLKKFLICRQTMQLQPKESEGTILNRVKMISDYLSGKIKEIDPSEESLLKEVFGQSFLTDKFYLDIYETFTQRGDENAK